MSTAGRSPGSDLALVRRRSGLRWTDRQLRHLPAIGYIGGVFGAVAALLYPIVGATAARLRYRKNITPRAAVGIGIVIVGGLVIFTPGIMAELTGTGDGAWLGYLGGLIAMFGWGLEGAIADRALDVSDPDVGLTLRFTAEVFIWS